MEYACLEWGHDTTVYWSVCFWWSMSLVFVYEMHEHSWIGFGHLAKSLERKVYLG